MKFSRLLIILFVAISSIVYGSPKSVLKESTTNAILEDLIFPNLRNLKIASGATLEIENGATLTVGSGVISPWGNLYGDNTWSGTNTFSVPPVMSGASITTNTIPIDSLSSSGASSSQVPTYDGTNIVWATPSGSGVTNIFSTNSNGLVPMSGTNTSSYLKGDGTWGSGGSTTNASDLTTGTLDDARLSTNVPLLNSNNTFYKSSGAAYQYLNSVAGSGAYWKFQNAGTTYWNVGILDTANLSDFRISYSGATNFALGITTNNYVLIGGVGSDRASESLEVVGNVKASGYFSGSGASLTNIPVTALSTSGASSGYVPTYDGSTVAWAAQSGGSGTIDNGIQDFRLTLSSGTPVPSSDVTAATTLYLTPYKGNRLALYYSSSWAIYTTSQISASIPSNASTNSDVFAYYTGSAVALEFVSWSSDSARATALVYQNGVLVKNGDATRRYIGTIRTTATSGRCECVFGGTSSSGTAASWLVWNYYNRLPVTFVIRNSSDWTYSSPTIRALNGSTTNRASFVVGVAEDTVRASVLYTCYINTTFQRIYTAIGLNSTTTISGLAAATQPASSGEILACPAIYNGMPPIGFNYLQALDRGPASGTGSFEGSASNPGSGFVVEIKQ